MCMDSFFIHLLTVIFTVNSESKANMKDMLDMDGCTPPTWKDVGFMMR